MAAALLWAVSNTQVDVIDQKFFESGHSYLKADSIHAKIEQTAKKSMVYTPDEWEAIIKKARINPCCFIDDLIKILQNLYI